ncbi:50S ribosomal protein L20 [Candidatus Gracilibacteria bacterium]|jgi:large subunit ribosomal protein L20|nr:50S ribosomal protein L20 [Candidatus Gracilibacteria bacterium]
MTRVKRGVMTHKRHKNILALAKGYRRMNGNVYSRAKNAIMKAGQNSYISRKLKKRQFRQLWTVRLNNATRLHGMNYSTFIHSMYTKRVGLNRKVLSNLAITNPEVFAKVVEFVK